MNSLNSVFDKIYCINLARRPDRWIMVNDEFNKINCSVTKFLAIDGDIIKKPNNIHINNNELGCLMSHYRILEDIINTINGEMFLILEDDVIFKNNFNTLFNEYYKQLPNDWDMVYLSGNNQQELTKITENIYKTEGTLATHSYFIKKKTAYGLKKIIDDNFFNNPVDVLFTNYQKTNNVYVFKPHLTTQRPGYSDIRGGFRNYDSVLNS